MENLNQKLLEAVQKLGFGHDPGTKGWKYFKRPDKTRLGGAYFNATFTRLHLDVKKGSVMDMFLLESTNFESIEHSSYREYKFEIYDEETLNRSINLMCVVASRPQDLRVLN